MDDMMEWYDGKKKGNYPVPGAFDNDGNLLGLCTFGPLRNRPAYKYSVEHYVYIRSDKRGKGLGTILLKELIKCAEIGDYHVLIGGNDL
jgi:L-amino acid N-acyltransferase YncA